MDNYDILLLEDMNVFQLEGRYTDHLRNLFGIYKKENLYYFYFCKLIKKMLTKRAAIKIVENFVKEVKASGVHVRRAVLFGSYAHGKPHKWSDIDVALVADEFKGLGYNDSRYYAIIKCKGYLDISLRTYNTKDFTPKVDPFVEVIMEKGIEIKC